MPDISEQKYQELLGDQAKGKTFEIENIKLKETAENTKIALKANRDEISNLKTDKETVQTEFDTFKTDNEKELTKLENFDETKANAEKWTQYETSLTEARTTKIEEMKTKLGQDFMKANESFLDGLPEDKVETFLNGNIEALEGDKKSVITGTGDNSMKSSGGTTHKTDFDEAISKGDANAAMSAIPAPGSY